MAAISTGSQVGYTIIEEVTYGVTPAITPGDTNSVPFISNNINLSKGIFEDPSIRSDRQERFNRHGNREAAGDVTFAYSHETYDTFLESVMFGAFDISDELRLGNTLKSFTVEVGHTDINQYRTFTGLVGSTFNLEVNLDGVVQS